jgi:hypothetical protein
MGQIERRPLPDLQADLRRRAAARGAELLTGTAHDGTSVAAFVRLHEQPGERDAVFVWVRAGEERTALASLLAADAERPGQR